MSTSDSQFPRPELASLFLRLKAHFSATFNPASSVFGFRPFKPAKAVSIYFHNSPFGLKVRPSKTPQAVGLGGLNGSELLIVAGLLLDIGGITLLWKYGLSDMLAGNEAVMTIEGKFQKEKAGVAIYQVHQNAGLALIILGFAPPRLLLRSYPEGRGFGDRPCRIALPSFRGAFITVGCWKGAD